MKMIITGGAGFVGSHVVDQLLARGHEVAILDHWKKEKKRFVPKGVQVVKEDVTSEHACEFVRMYQPDAICHLAAQISVPYSVKHPTKDAHINIVGTVNLMQAAQECGVKRFVYISSCGVYGDAPDLPLREDTVLQPKSPYALSKKAGEEYAQYFGHESSLRVLTIRPANLYGPRQQMVGEAGVIAIFLDKIIRGEVATVTGDGTATRDWLYVEDAADAIVRALECDMIGTVNIGTGIEKKVQDLVNTLKTIHGESAEFAYTQQRPGDIYRSYLDVSRAEKELDWRATTSFEQGLKKTYEWFKKYGI